MPTPIVWKLRKLDVNVDAADEVSQDVNNLAI